MLQPAIGLHRTLRTPGFGKVPFVTFGPANQENIGDIHSVSVLVNFGILMAFTTKGKPNFEKEKCYNLLPG